MCTGVPPPPPVPQLFYVCEPSKVADSPLEIHYMQVIDRIIL